MGLYGASAVSISYGGIGVSSEIRAGASERTRLLEAGVCCITTSATLVALVRPLTMGVSPSTEVTVAPIDTDGPTGETKIATAWSTRPTAPAYCKRPGYCLWVSGVLTNPGWKAVFSAPRGLLIPASESLVFLDLQLIGTYALSIVVDE